MNNYKMYLKNLSNLEFIKSSRILSVPSLPGLLRALVIIAVVGFYWPVLTDIVTSMLDNQDTSFGLILPFVSLYIVYRSWPQIRQHPLRSSWSGMVVLIFGFVLYFFGELFQSWSVPFFSFIIVLTGVVIVIGGWSLLRQLAFPLFLFMFLIPYEGFIVQKITLPLQLISSDLAAKMLGALGVTFHIQGNIIDLGNRQLNVVEACSGLRYIVNLWALGAIFCCFFQNRWWKIAIIMALIVPFAIVANALRIATIGLYPMFEKGLWHTSLGLSIFLLGFDYLKLINWSVNRISSVSSNNLHRDIKTKTNSKPERVTSTTPYLIVALILVALSGPMVLYFSSDPPRKPLQPLEYFPLKIGPWHGSRRYITDKLLLKYLAADSYLDIGFSDQNEHYISLWIAYYGNSRRGKRFHSPEGCLPGSGWQILESKIVTTENGLPIRYMLVQQGGDRQLVYFWYIQCGRWSYESRDLKRLSLSMDNLIDRRSDDALIRIMTPASNDIQNSKVRLDKFVKNFTPILKQYLAISNIK